MVHDLPQHPDKFIFSTLLQLLAFKNLGFVDNHGLIIDMLINTFFKLGKDFILE